jgi:hypothetical protein
LNLTAGYNKIPKTTREQKYGGFQRGRFGRQILQLAPLSFQQNIGHAGVL